MFLMVKTNIDFLPILIVLATAWLIPMVMSLLSIKSIPTVIVEIIAGYFIGHYLFCNMSHESTMALDYLAYIGFIFLMFESGLELDISKILSSLPKKTINKTHIFNNPLISGVLFFLIAIGLSYSLVIGLSTKLNIPNIWYFSLILVTTSVGVVVPVLKNRGESESKFGQMTLTAGAIADIMSIVLFTFTAFILSNGFQLKLLIIVVIFLLFLFLYRAGNKARKVLLFRRLLYQLSHATAQIKLRGTFLILVLFLSISNHLGHEVTLLGAFLSGLLLSAFIIKDRSILVVQLNGFSYGFFIPIFFIMVGASFDPTALKEFDNSLFFILASLLFIIYAVKIIPSLLWKKIFGLKKTISGGILLSTQLGLIIAASQIGLELGIISPAINSCFILIAVLTCLVSPLAYNMMNKQNVLDSSKTIIVGGSSTGVLLTRRLKLQDKDTIIIEKDYDRYRDILAKGFNSYFGDGNDPICYKEIKLNHDDNIVVLTSDDKENYNICKMLREEYNHDKIISLSLNKQLNRKLVNLDIQTIDKIRVMATTIENYILRPTTYHALIESFESYIIDELIVKNKLYDGKQVKDVGFHNDCYLMLIRRGENMEIPHGDTYIKTGDTLVIFGTETALNDTKAKLI